MKHNHRSRTRSIEVNAERSVIVRKCVGKILAGFVFDLNYNSVNGSFGIFVYNEALDFCGLSIYM